MDVSGGAIAGGAAVIPVWTGQGGAIAGGEINHTLGYAYPATGGAIVGGAALIPVWTGQGGAVTGGIFGFIRHDVMGISGGGTVGGNARWTDYRTIPGLPDDAILCTINTTPPQNYTLQDRILSIGSIRKPMGGIIGNLENANASITLDNSDGQLTAFFSPPPIGVKLTLQPAAFGGQPYFSGVITQITLGQTITLQLEAGERIPLSTCIPLVSTTQLPGYRVDKAIPLVYGTVTVEPSPPNQMAQPSFSPLTPAKQ
jgi:hypothetical protein